jgi:hypothetical protein
VIAPDEKLYILLGSVQSVGSRSTPPCNRSSTRLDSDCAESETPLETRLYRPMHRRTAYVSRLGAGALASHRSAHPSPHRTRTATPPRRDATRREVTLTGYGVRVVVPRLALGVALPLASWTTHGDGRNAIPPFSSVWTNLPPSSISTHTARRPRRTNPSPTPRQARHACHRASRDSTLTDYSRPSCTLVAPRHLQLNAYSPGRDARN